MRADELLTILQRYQETGRDLSTMDVVVEYTNFDPSIPYDMGVDDQVYPEGVCIRNGELIIGRDI
jgi:hypothetical protein